MDSIDDVVFQEKIKPIFETLFSNEDPYGSPFHSSVNHRLLLFPYRYGLLDRQSWLLPVTEAIKTIGEDGFYLTLLKRVGDQPWHWYVPLHEAGNFVKAVFPVENAIYSVNGRWGIICSEEDHAIAGGTEEFIECIHGAINDWDFRLESFLEMWKENTELYKSKIDWLPTLLTHIYGAEIAKSIMNNSFADFT